MNAYKRLKNISGAKLRKSRLVLWKEVACTEIKTRNEKPSFMLGYSYTPYDRCTDVFILFPFNHIVAWLRKVWRRIRHAKPNRPGVVVLERDRIELSLNEAFNQGYSIGHKNGYTKACHEKNMAFREALKLSKEHIKDE